MKKSIIINGTKTEGKGETIRIINPANLQMVCEYRAAVKCEVESAVLSARNALKEWKNYSIDDRAMIIKKAAEILVSSQGNPGDMVESVAMHHIIDEMGKSVYEAETEIFESADILNYFATEGKNYIKEENPNLDTMLWPSKKSVIKYSPCGVVGIIKAWNYPLEIPIWSIGAAILCGNTVVFKPSEYTPSIALWLCEVFEKAGLPSGVLNVICGDKRTGQYLIDSDIDMVSFTGSTEAGLYILQQCSRRNIKCTLEMGGKDPAIVCEDADIERSVNGIVWGALANAGQVCVSAERVFVHEKIYDIFLNRVLDKVKTLIVGNGWNSHTDVTPLISKKQLDWVHTQVMDALHKGARLLYGGEVIRGNNQENGFFYSPTVIDNVNNSMSVFVQETFGPVIAIRKFNNYDIMIKEVNDSEYGLGASVWTSSDNRAALLSDRIDAGMIWINDINLCFPQCPWSGIKKSGLGYDLSKHGLFEYCKIKHVSYEKDAQPTQPWWYPYNK